MRLLCILLFLAHSPNVSAVELKVASGGTVKMHNVEDYWSLIPLDVLSVDARAEIVKTAVSRTSDVISATGRYYLHSDFVGNGVVLMSELVIIAPKEDSSFAMSELHRGALLGIARKGGKHRELPCPEGWVDQCYFDVIGRTQGEAFGNILFIRRGQAIYSVTLSGLGGFEESDDIQEFLGEKALAALKFRPNPNELQSALAGSGAKSGGKAVEEN
jgi:hypothetical protein